MNERPNISPPPHHDWVETEDGSFTIYSKNFQESAHSVHGAIAETRLRFIEGCKIRERLKTCSSPFTIFETGFGLGIGALETFSVWNKEERKYPLHFISSEIDEELVAWIIRYADKLFATTYGADTVSLLQSLVFDKSGSRYHASSTCGNFSLTIYMGNITTKQQQLVNNHAHQVHAIFQDAYSPKKNPELWTVSWFQCLKELCASDAILSTYSSSQSIRQNLQEAGFRIENGPGFGKKKSSTFAYPVS
jgi:tRNA U34 5-methylaminomethyl-2-thiouridine-forming methyltransferase MnmC